MRERYLIARSVVPLLSFIFGITKLAPVPGPCDALTDISAYRIATGLVARVNRKSG